MSARNRAQARLTKAFISQQPVTLVLTPRERSSTSSGGTKWVEQTPRSPQVMTLIEPGSTPLPVVTLDGVQRETEFELLGEHDAAIGEYDVFTHDGYDYEVVRLSHDNGWEQRALVSKIG